MDILDGVETVGIWPGQLREYRRDDWEVGFRDRHGGHHKLVRVHDADRDKSYAYYLWLSEGDNDNWSLYVKRDDGANWCDKAYAYYQWLCDRDNDNWSPYIERGDGLLGKIVDWVHEIKHNGYRMIVHRDGATVRIYSRNANDWTARLRAIADSAARIKAGSFTIDGEAVVLGPDGLSRFEELSRREAADTAILYAFDLVEHDGEVFLDRKAALARLLRNTGAGILFNEHIAEVGTVVFAHACRLGAKCIVSKKVDSTYRSGFAAMARDTDRRDLRRSSARFRLAS
jgi:bifunctional non-homologous end joining protein LigD